MESWCFVKHKKSLLMFMMFLVFMFGWAKGISMDDERKALLEIKASLNEVSNNVDYLLPTWADHGKHCNWERIKCNTTTGLVTELSLGNMFSMEDEPGIRYVLSERAREGINWPLNASHFLHFKELRKLDLSLNFIGNTFVSAGFERFSDLKELENLNLSFNLIEANIFPLLSELTSLKVLDISYINVDYIHRYTHEISEFQVPENLEVLNANGGRYYGTLQIQGSHETSSLSNLRTLNLADNKFNESLVTSISTLTSLERLDLSINLLNGRFPSQEISHLINLKKLDLSYNNLYITPSIQGTMSNLQHLTLDGNQFSSVDDVMSSMAAFPSLKFLSLGECNMQGRLFANEAPNLPYLEVLILRWNRFNGTLPMKALASFHRLKVLDLSGNRFVGSIPSTIKSLSFLQAVSFANNQLNGSLTTDGKLSKNKLRFELK